MLLGGFRTYDSCSEFYIIHCLWFTLVINIVTCNTVGLFLWFDVLITKLTSWRVPKKFIVQNGIFAINFFFVQIELVEYLTTAFNFSFITIFYATNSLSQSASIW